MSLYRTEGDVFSNSAAYATVLLLLVAEPSGAQNLRIGIIDFYGLHHVSERHARDALGIREGDAVPDSVKEAVDRLKALPGVVNAQVRRVCCDAGMAILYVGIEERGTRALRFRSPPRGAVRLPNDVVEAGEAFFKALMEAVQRGDATEDDSQGHALMHDPAGRAIQERFIASAARDLDRLREVLHRSADGEQRALAALVLGYAANKRDVVGDLVRAVRDPEEEVRNDSMRALAIIAGFAQRSPTLRIRVPTQPFIDLLNSVVWSDRNKASFALMELSTGRDPVLLGNIRKHALASLIEMARWKSQGHAGIAVMLLGRLAGWSEDDIQAAWDRGDREAVIDAALKSTRHSEQRK